MIRARNSRSGSREGRQTTEQLYFSVKLVVMPGPRIVQILKHSSEHPHTHHLTHHTHQLPHHGTELLLNSTQRILHQESNLRQGPGPGLGEKLYTVIQNSTQDCLMVYLSTTKQYLRGELFS